MCRWNFRVVSGALFEFYKNNAPMGFEAPAAALDP